MKLSPPFDFWNKDSTLILISLALFFYAMGTTDTSHAIFSAFATSIPFGFVWWRHDKKRGISVPFGSRDE